jgi:hypothetical protein
MNDATIISMKIIQDWAAFLFVLATAILTGVCVLGVWNVFAHDVVWKSFETVGLLAGVAVAVMVAGKFLRTGSAATQELVLPDPAFTTIRKVTLSIFIISAGTLALFGVLAIWGVISDKTTLYRSIGSLAVLAFGTFIMVVTCMERENNPLLKQENVSFGGVVVALIMIYLIFSFSGLFS